MSEGEESEFDEEGYWKDAASAEWSVREVFRKDEATRDTVLQILASGGVPDWTLDISNELLEYQDDLLTLEQEVLELFGENLVGQESANFKEEKESKEFRILELQTQMEEIKVRLHDALSELVVREEEDDESAQQKHSVGFVADVSSDQAALPAD